MSHVPNHSIDLPQNKGKHKRTVLLLITNLSPVIVCLQETLLKQNDKNNIKEYHQYNNTHENGPRAPGGTPIRVCNDVSQSEINLITIVIQQLLLK